MSIIYLSVAIYPYPHFHNVTTTMSTITLNQTLSLKSPAVHLHALSAGHLTLPEKYFVHPASATARRTVPSLAFLIQHRHPTTGKLTRLVFDLGLRRDIQLYAVPIQKHAETRQPLSTDPDVVKSLARGGLTPGNIDYVVYSHVCSPLQSVCLVHV